MGRVRAEIRDYPAPIPACDAQFNFLLEEREALTSELSRIRELMERNAGSEDDPVSVDDYLTASKCLSDAAKDEIRALMNNDKK